MDKSIIAQLTSDKNKRFKPVDCTDDLVMIKAGLRSPHVNINYEEFKHLPGDKKVLKAMKNEVVNKESTKGGATFVEKESKPFLSLKVFVFNKDKTNTFRTTHAFRCHKEDVPTLIERVATMTYNNGSPYIVTKVTLEGEIIFTKNL